MGIEARISSKGQTTIPAEVREKLGLHTGDRIAFIEMEQGYLIIPRNRPVDILFGALAEYAIPGTTIEDYDRAAGEGVSDHVEGPKKGKDGTGA
ncbi:MAG TPA: AbrB/MazE/SpoVT family DNA-binding domain-containing protein [Rhizobiaceae bacterium]